MVSDTSEIALEQAIERHLTGAATEALSEGTAATKDAMGLKKFQITRLKGYKTVLINAAVTGKIKVTADGLAGMEEIDTP